MAEFINKGDTYLSRNFPGLSLPKMDKAHRLLHIHRNVPGVMAQMNKVFAENSINIVAQFLVTRGSIGYAVTHVDTQFAQQLLRQLRQLENATKFRDLV